MRFWFKQFFSDPKAHKEAFEEILIVSLVSLIPLILLAVVDQLRAERHDMWIVFETAVSSGQLYLYSFAMLGMIFWLCWKDHEQWGRFPPGRYLALVAFLLSALIIAVYSSDPALSKVLSPPLIRASIVIYVVYTCLYYILRVYDNLRPPPIERQLKSESDALAARYKEQTAGQNQ
jgi:amino acid transporter